MVAQAPGTVVRLTFVDVASGTATPQRVVRLADHFVSQLLPYFDQYALSHRLWSPDSASILLPLVDASGRDQVVVVPADGFRPAVGRGRGQGVLEPVANLQSSKSGVCSRLHGVRRLGHAWVPSIEGCPPQ